MRVLRFLAAAATALGICAAPHAAAAEARVLQPAGEWVLSDDAESCSITRQFGADGDAGVSFRLQAFSPGQRYRLVLRGDPLPQRDSGLLEFEYRFAPDSEAVSAAGVLAKSNRVPMVQTTVDAAATANATEFVIAFSRGRPLALQLGALETPLDQLRTCALELPRKWGLDPAVQQALQRPAMPLDQESWLGPGTYPWSYLRNAQSLMVHLRMMVDAQGMPEACVVQFPTRQSGATELACREIMKTARFQPALDSSGVAVSSYVTTTVFYYTRRHNGPISRGRTITGH